MGSEEEQVEETTFGIKIDPESINRYVAETIAASSIGEALKKVIDEEIAKASKSYDNPYRPVVSEVIRAEMNRLVTEEFGDEIRKAVRERVDEEFVNELISKMSDSWQKVVRGY
jgi:transcriptional accessory protein Tex/SPT6